MSFHGRFITASKNAGLDVDWSGLDVGRADEIERHPMNTKQRRHKIKGKIYSGKGYWRQKTAGDRKKEQLTSIRQMRTQTDKDEED